MAKVLKLAAYVATTWRELVLFARNPRQVVSARKQNWAEPIAVYPLSGADQHRSHARFKGWQLDIGNHPVIDIL